MYIKKRIRSLRKQQTKSEKIFWDNFRNRQFNNLKFIRQYPVKLRINEQNTFFVIDFYCAEHKLGIEIDGNIHDIQVDYDKLRTELINQFNIKIIRFKNSEILSNIDHVKNTIEQEIKSPLCKERRREGI